MEWLFVLYAITAIVSTACAIAIIPLAIIVFRKDNVKRALGAAREELNR